MAFEFALGEELELLVKTARDFAGRRLAPAIREAERRRGVAAAVRDDFEAIGLDRLELPDALGGAGLGSLSRVLVNEELGATDPGAALALDPLGTALHALDEFGGNALLQRLLLPLLERPGARALLVTGHDGSIGGDDGRLEAAIPWVPADAADLLVVLEGGRLRVLREGFELRPLPGSGLRAAGGAELHADDAEVVFCAHDGAAAARAMARVRLYQASLLLGVLRQSTEYATAYAQQRVAFGRPIGHHQALAFALVDMHAAVAMGRLLVREAALRIEHGGDAVAPAASALVEVIEASRSIGPMGVQVLGGHGFMQDHPVEKYNRECRALSLLHGGIDAARDDAASDLDTLATPIELSPLAAAARVTAQQDAP
ncbi:MAG: acyl-CoA/acyl-ACP dehydrogenase [Myxococcales bacterium]|nr:acyl-CoA/acyl-ACP dehydrogenase [Myxococcales bacterium]